MNNKGSNKVIKGNDSMDKLLKRSKELEEKNNYQFNSQNHKKNVKKND